MIKISGYRIERFATTEDALLEWVKYAEVHGADAKGVLFRQRFRDLIPVKSVCKKIFGESASWSLPEATWTHSNGATLKMRHLARWEDTREFAAQTFTFMVIDQADEFVKHDPIKQVTASLRTAAGVPLRFLTTGEVRK